VHNKLLDMPLPEDLSKVKPNGCFIDVKSRFDRDALQSAGLCVWRL
jgi:UDP-N-acetyl-D-galactosamine dehydrogenase